MTAEKNRQKQPSGILLSWVLVIIYGGFIFILSSLSTQALRQLPRFYMSDKIFHFIEFFIFGMLLFRAFRAHLEPRKAFLSSFFMASFYGFTDELHQYLVPLRNAEALDLLADSAGGLTGAYLALILNKGAQLGQG